MIRVAICDLDGLLSDTEKLHFEAYRRALADRGVSLSEDTYAQHWIRDGKGIADFVREHSLALDADLLRRSKAGHYDRLVRSEVQAMPGAADLLNRLGGHFKLALATSSYADSAAAVLQTLGFVPHFDLVVTNDDVSQVKPAPDLFLLAARKLGVQPGECVALEDSEKGVVAAYRAGMLCIAVPNIHTRDHDFSRATRVVASLSEVTPECIHGLARGQTMATDVSGR